MDLFDAPFYWGRITRQDAEEVLNQLGLDTGLYLVREKYEEAGAYAITLVCLKRFYHYRIDRLNNDNVVLNGSRVQEKLSSPNDDSKHIGSQQALRNSNQKEFSGPMKLIKYFQKHADTLVTTLSIPCQRPSNHNIVRYWCIPLMTPDLYMNKILQEASSTDPDIPIKDKLTVKRYIYERRVLKTLHENELWFHSRIGRQEAELRLKTAGGKSGLFLIREKAGEKRFSACYTLSLCFHREYHHYIIQKTTDGYLQIASSNKSTQVNRFGSIAQLIDFYHRNHQDLACPLRIPCDRPGGSVRIISLQNFLEIDKSTESETSFTDLWSPTSPSSNDSMNTSSFDSMSTLKSTTPSEDNHRFKFTEKVLIDEKYLILGDKLGEGQFGEVYNGKLIVNDENHNGISKQVLQQVAIKRLRQRQTSLVEELYNEGERMLNLDHPYIVKLYGLCKHETSISLVLELCPYGAMNHWLKSNKTFQMNFILNYMYQVSDGMNYLHEKHIIHRDLALRNILIMSTTICKISDFGLSRALAENNYYQVAQNRKLPSIWYPPEVLETPRFHSRIDIWSYGITVWEATSYGQTPYKQELIAMAGISFDPISKKLLKFLRAGNRLKQPENCPDPIYDLMLKCWDNDKYKRPSFAWIKQYLSIYAISDVEENDRV